MVSAPHQNSNSKHFFHRREYSANLDEYVDGRINKLMPILEEFFGAKIEMPKVYYTGATGTGFLGAYLPGLNSIIIPYKSFLNRKGRIRVPNYKLDFTLAHEIAHAFYYGIIGGVSNSMYNSVDEFLARLENNNFAPELTHHFDKYNSTLHVYESTSESIADTAAIFVTSRLYNYPLNEQRMFAQLLRVAEGYGEQANVITTYYGTAVHSGAFGMASFHNENTPAIIGSARVLLGNRLHPYTCLAEAYAKRAESGTPIPVQAFIIETALNSVPPEALKNSPFWGALPTGVTPEAYEKWKKTIMAGIVGPSEDSDASLTRKKIAETLNKARKLKSLLISKAKKTDKQKEPKFLDY